MNCNDLRPFQEIVFTKNYVSHPPCQTLFFPILKNQPGLQRSYSDPELKENAPGLGCFDRKLSHRLEKKLRKKDNWFHNEDQLLLQLVKRFGPRNWSKIAGFFFNRQGKQCRERWHNHLNPFINKSKWTEQEDRVLLKAFLRFGSKWAVIARYLPGRTDNCIKNHFNSTIRRRLRMKELTLELTPLRIDSQATDVGSENRLVEQFVAVKEIDDSDSKFAFLRQAKLRGMCASPNTEQNDSSKSDQMILRLPVFNQDILQQFQPSKKFEDLFGSLDQIDFKEIKNQQKETPQKNSNSDCKTQSAGMFPRVSFETIN